MVLSPWLGLRDFSIVSDLNDQAGGRDVTLTMGAGLRGYLPAGSKGLVAAHAIPEYVWWRDAESKRRLNGRYGLGVFVFLNRLRLELSQRRLEQQRFFSSEIHSLTSLRDDISTLSLGLEVTPRISLIGGVNILDHSNREQDNAASFALDRKEENGFIGVRYENAGGYILELAHMDLASDFADRARNLSNSGTAEQVSIGLDRRRLGFRLDFAFNRRQADQGSDFGRFDDTTGSFNVLWTPSNSFAILGYARRAQNYSIDERFALYLQERLGARTDFDFGRVGISLFAEIGQDDFQASSPAGSHRIDDVIAYGAELAIKLREVKLSARATYTDYDSDFEQFEQFDRGVTRFEIGIEIRAVSRFTSKLVDKMSLGSAGTDW